MSQTGRRLPAFILTVLLGASACAGCAPDLSPPNIVVIYIDDLGWRDLSLAGSEYYETPNIDQLATEGMQFTNAYANAPNCAPSRASLLTGMYTPRHGIYTVGSAARGPARLRKLVPVENQTELDSGFVTIAEALAPAGYTSAHIGKWHLGGEGHLPEDQGFDLNVAGNQRGSPPSYFYPYGDSSRALPGLQQSGSEGEYLTDRLTDEAIRFLTEHQDERFFLYLSHYAVHTPIQGKPELVERYRTKQTWEGHDNPTYAAMIHSTDVGVGRLLETLDELGLAENTVVIFYADNGGFGPVTSMAPLRGSKGMLYEGGIREPLIVRWPDHIEAGTVSDSPVIGTDLYPTILDIARASPREDQLLDGLSLLPLLRGEAVLPERPLYWHFPAYLEADRSVVGPWRTTPVSAVRLDDFKLIHFFEESRWELYDLERDIGESTDLANAMPEKAAELRLLLEDWWAATEAWIPTEPNPEYRGAEGSGRTGID